MGPRTRERLQSNSNPSSGGLTRCPRLRRFLSSGKMPEHWNKEHNAIIEESNYSSTNWILFSLVHKEQDQLVGD